MSNIWFKHENSIYELKRPKLGTSRLTKPICQALSLKSVSKLTIKINNTESKESVHLWHISNSHQAKQNAVKVNFSGNGRLQRSRFRWPVQELLSMHDWSAVALAVAGTSTIQWMHDWSAEALGVAGAGTMRCSWRCGKLQYMFDFNSLVDYLSLVNVKPTNIGWTILMVSLRCEFFIHLNVFTNGIPFARDIELVLFYSVFWHWNVCCLNVNYYDQCTLKYVQHVLENRAILSQVQLQNSVAHELVVLLW